MALLQTPGMLVGKTLNLPVLKFSTLCLSYFIFSVLWGASMVCVILPLEKSWTLLHHVTKAHPFIELAKASKYMVM